MSARVYYAIGDVCTHDDGPLGDGDLEGFHIVCPRHGAEFDVRTGKAMMMPATINVAGSRPIARVNVRPSMTRDVRTALT